MKEEICHLVSQCLKYDMEGRPTAVSLVDQIAEIQRQWESDPTRNEWPDEMFNLEPDFN